MALASVRFAFPAAGLIPDRGYCYVSETWNWTNDSFFKYSVWGVWEQFLFCGHVIFKCLFLFKSQWRNLGMAKDRPTQRIFSVVLVSTKAMETKLLSPWHSLKDIERGWKALLVCKPVGSCCWKWGAGQMAGFWWPTLSIHCTCCKSTCRGGNQGLGCIIRLNFKLCTA